MRELTHHPGTLAQPGEDDDPISETYDLYLTPSVKSVVTEPTQPESSITPKVLLLQYPDRRITQPYKALTHQKPTSFRLKPKTGLVEVEVPIDTENNYNASKGDQYASSMHRSRILSAGGSQGLAGGFNTGPQPYNTQRDMDTIPHHSDNKVHTQTLGGKIKQPAEGDPFYMLGYLKDNAVHLSRLDALVQLRPQLPHLDAADEVQRHVERTRTKMEPGENTSKGQPRAVEMKITRVEKTPEEAARARNETLLQSIQDEKWTTYNWNDHDTYASASRHDQCLRMPFADEATQLKASMDNSAWLDAMSAPRIDPVSGKTGSKGLLGKVKGREREKRRRKTSEKRRQEREQAATKISAAERVVDREAESEEDESETDSEESEREVETLDADAQVVEKEPSPSIAKRKGKAPVRPVQATISTPPVQMQPKKRGRSPKNSTQGASVMVID